MQLDNRDVRETVTASMEHPNRWPGKKSNKQTAPFQVILDHNDIKVVVGGSEN